MNTSKPLYLFANWKMYLNYEESLTLAQALAAHVNQIPERATVGIFPSSLALAAVADLLKATPLLVGAQNAYWIPEGGYTGEISMAMCRLVGARYVLVGHSERRRQFHETNHEVREKLAAALLAGLVPVLCVGETYEEREQGESEEVVEAQLRAAFHNITWPPGVEILIAYEPVWAISRGRDKLGLDCTSAEAGRMHELIGRLASGLIPGASPVVIFGGSVRPETVLNYFGEPAVGGVLVGAASTHPESWLKILQAVSSQV